MVELRASRCAICGTEGNAAELHLANFSPDSLNPAVFSARRLPDRLHFRLVKCNVCGLIRSDPLADAALLEQLYTRSAFTYSTEVEDLRHTYGLYLRRLGRFGARKGALLEVGCGNGFFLEQALTQGYASVRGVEPSRQAVALAPPHLQSSIRCDVMRPGLFDPAQFDVVCLFQVLDHFADPKGVLNECFAVLRPGGLVLALNHNTQALSARLMGELSPIFDIEHTYLYSPRTMSRLFSACGFQVRYVRPAFNRFPLRYLLRISPLPAAVKNGALAAFEALRLAGLRLSLPIGNLVLIAQRPT